MRRLGSSIWFELAGGSGYYGGHRVGSRHGKALVELKAYGDSDYEIYSTANSGSRYCVRIGR
jgi:hypothetical protein